VKISMNIIKSSNVNMLLKHRYIKVWNNFHRGKHSWKLNNFVKSKKTKGYKGYSQYWLRSPMYEEDNLSCSNKYTIKTQISHLVCTTRFWNNLHQVHPKLKDMIGEIMLKSLWAWHLKGFNEISKIGKGRLSKEYLSINIITWFRICKFQKHKYK